LASSQYLRTRNTTSTERVLWIEPLGDCIALKSNALYELAGTDEFGAMEIDLAEDGIVIHGWVSKVMTLHDNGGDVVEWQLVDNSPL
jgi:hypothetical protein